MNWKRGLGIGLIFIGFFICLTARVITGAVVGFSPENYLGLLGVLVLISGIVLIFSEVEWATHKTKIPLEKIIEAGRDDNTIFVLDTSGASAYKSNLYKLIEAAEGRVYVPKRVIEELKKDARNENLVYNVLKPENIRQMKSRGSPIAEKNYRKIRNIAREALEKTKKHKDYLKFKEIIETDRKPGWMDEEDYQDYKRRIEEEINVKLRGGNREPTKANQLWLLKKEYRVSKGDLDVLTTALGNAIFGKKAKVIAEDTHLRDAIEKLKSKYRGLEYVDYAKYDKKYAKV